MIHSSLKAEGKTTRVIGHEVLGEVAEIGAVARAHYGLKEGDLCAAESHIVCGRCHQCLGRLRQVVEHDGAPMRRQPRLGCPSLAGAHEDRHRADGHRRLQVAQTVADRRHAGEIDAVP